MPGAEPGPPHLSMLCHIGHLFSYSSQNSHPALRFPHSSQIHTRLSDSHTVQKFTHGSETHMAPPRDLPPLLYRQAYERASGTRLTLRLQHYSPACQEAPPPEPPGCIPIIHSIYQHSQEPVAPGCVVVCISCHSLYFLYIHYFTLYTLIYIIVRHSHY